MRSQVVSLQLKFQTHFTAGTGSKSLHANSIVEISQLSNYQDDIEGRFMTVGLDGQIVVWDVIANSEGTH